MNWDAVPTSLTPVYQRIDSGLMMPYRWSPELRELWRMLIEMGI